MSSIGAFFRKLGASIATGYRHFMQGRYGGDKLNIALVWASLAAYIIHLFIPVAMIKLVMILVYYGLLVWAIFRMLSRNTYKRYEENRKYLRFLERIRDRKHKYFDCPRCRQTVRVPRGKGKISITCPKCREKFVRKT